MRFPIPTTRGSVLRAALFTLALVAFAVPGAAFEGQLSNQVMPIAAVRSSAEKGDPVTISGAVITAEEERFFKLKDDTGEMYVRIPESVRRQWGTPKRHDELVCAGKYTRAYLDEETWGVHCQRIEIVPQMAPPADAE